MDGQEVKRDQMHVELEAERARCLTTLRRMASEAGALVSTARELHQRVAEFGDTVGSVADVFEGRLEELCKLTADMELELVSVTDFSDEESES